MLNVYSLPYRLSKRTKRIREAYSKYIEMQNPTAMNETEGLIRYRLLGSHPAASGRYLTLGFPGESITAARLLQAVITEHQINLSTFKLSIVKLPAPAHANHARKADGTLPDGGIEEAVPIHETDTLRTYDILAITVSKRSLMDKTTQETHQRILEQKLLVKEIESELGMAPAGPLSAPLERAGRPDHRGAEAAKPNQQPAAVDPLGFERAAALAMKTFPLSRGRRGLPEAPPADAKPPTCVLCDLAVFREVRTACCDLPACATCLEASKGMTMADGECPVCGRKGETSGHGGAASDLIKREREDNELFETAKVAKSESTLLNSSYGGNRNKSLTSSYGVGMERPKEARGVGDCYASNAKTEGGYRRLHAMEDSCEDVPSVGRCVEDLRSAYINGLAEIPQIEQQLQKDLDQILSYLDVPDPLTEETKARRKRSKTLTFMDEQILQI
ncbi:unnamed protein product [Phytomonas sp. Hart1]|nr:unnamed protein product [Phytomonas sp. Hart1]|eukprot:CCW71464.1 unnamed protein product [Phytomonas sp. isolate Hart1]